MNFYLDSADITTIDQYVKNYNIKGVTATRRSSSKTAVLYKNW